MRKSKQIIATRYSNLVISLLRMAGATNIARAVRYWARQGLRVLRFLGLAVA